MFRKTTLLTAAAVLALGAAPALAAPSLAQDTPPADAQSATPPAAGQGSLTLQPGSEVKGADGAVLGKLEGVTTIAGTQQLTVRGDDDVVRGVPLSGLQPDGAGVKVAMTSAEFQASAPVPETPSTQPNPPAPQPPTETPN